MSAVQARQEEARRKRRRKKRSGSSLVSSCFQGKYEQVTAREERGEKQTKQERKNAEKKTKRLECLKDSEILDRECSLQRCSNFCNALG